MAYGIDRLCDDIGALVAAEIRAQFDGTSVQVESPIERLFLAGAMALAHHVDTYEVLGLGLAQGVPEATDFGARGVLLGRQVRVTDYATDFLLSVLRADGASVARLVVECDGHDFHERTKEQAARDRSRDRTLQARGITVMRFTGSELYRDPMKCVCEALDWCLARQNEVTPR